MIGALALANKLLALVTVLAVSLAEDDFVFVSGFIFYTCRWIVVVGSLIYTELTYASGLQNVLNQSMIVATWERLDILYLKTVIYEVSQDSVL